MFKDWLERYLHSKSIYKPLLNTRKNKVGLKRYKES